MVTLLFIVAICVAVQLSTIAIVGMKLGVAIRQVDIGVGPCILRFGVWRLSLFPISGSVRFLDLRDESEEALEGEISFDSKTTWEQILIVLSGCIALFIIGLALLGPKGLQVFFELPGQIVRGAISPFGEAQILLSQLTTFKQSASFGTMLGTAALKMSAINLFPLPGFNGGAALVAIGNRLGISRSWPRAATVVLLFVWLGLFVAWFIAGAVYTTRA